EDPEMLKAVTGINREIRELAPVLNSPAVPDGARAKSSSPEVPVDTTVRRHDGATYVFAVGMRNGATRASFEVKGLPGSTTAEVIGEGRRVPVTGGRFEDAFAPYAVHLYRIRPF